MKKKLSEKQKWMRRIRSLENELADQDYQRGIALDKVKNLEADKAHWKNQYDLMYKEKDRFYTETQVQKAKIHRLEKAVTALKEAHQKTLLAFDVLN